MTDLECRRRAMQLTPQLPGNPKDRRKVLRYMGQFADFLDGDLDLPEPQREAAE